MYSQISLSFLFCYFLGFFGGLFFNDLTVIYVTLCFAGLAFLNTEKYTTFLPFSSATFAGIYCSFYCGFGKLLCFLKFL